MKQFLYLLAVAALLTTACHKTDTSTGSRPLAISGFWPSSGNAGTIVTISGSGFSSTPQENGVSFNGAAARVMEANDTTIIAEAPADGATGVIAVTVNGKTAKGSNPYTYQALSIHGISPVNGPAGTNITINGAGFTSTSGPAAVTINGKPAIVS
ncbi:MAG TPA: IPT/TIG domain-containing protein, partial [Chitinophaga sp.]